MEQLIKKLPNELQSKIFLYNSYVPFKKFELNDYINNIKAVYFDLNYDLLYIDINHYKAISNKLLKIYNLNNACNLCPYVIKNKITDNVFCYIWEKKNIKKFINKRFIYNLK